MSELVSEPLAFKVLYPGSVQAARQAVIENLADEGFGSDL